MLSIPLSPDDLSRLEAVAAGRDLGEVAASIVAAVLADDEAAHRAPKPWTPADDRTLRTGRAMKLTPAGIAKMLGRPKDEVAARLRALKL